MRFIVFQTVILQCDWHMNVSGTIRRSINCWMDAWEAEEFEMLTEDMVRTWAQYLSISRGEDTPDHWEKIYHILVLWGKLNLAVQLITDRKKGGVFQPGYICYKTVQPILEVLCLNHPGTRPPTAINFESYGGKTPAFMPVNTTDEMVA